MKIYPDKSTPYLILALATGISAHIPNIPLWVTLCCFISWGYLLISGLKNIPIPRKIFLHTLTLCAFFIVWAESGRTFGNDSGIKLLCLMACLKPYEIRGQRDRMLTIFLAYFMVISSLFFSTSVAMTIFMIASIILITGLLIKINNHSIPLTNSFKLSGTLVAQSLPVMLILFFIFPRLSGSIWGIKLNHQNSSGFSDSLSPGSVSKMVKDNSIAFRVSFLSKYPGFSKLYWRGIVFDKFNGQKWETKKDLMQGEDNFEKYKPVEYKVIMEHADTKWLFPLEMSGNKPYGTIKFKNNTIKKAKNMQGKKDFKFTSFLSYKTGNRNSPGPNFTRLPERGNNKSKKLALKLRKESVSTEDYANKIMNLFNSQKFYYSLNAPASDTDIIDNFLFTSKKGYCEHYASAFVFLMRAVNIPSRIIGGYMGGEMNPYGNYLIVRQSDAHAWAEIWIKNKGWVRFDPTSSVAPDRVEKGTAASLPKDEIPAFLSTSNYSFVVKIFNNIKLGWDSVNYHWDTKIVRYSVQRQRALMKKFGLNMKSYKHIIILFMLGITPIILLIIILFIHLKKKAIEDNDPVLEIYRVFTDKLKKRGITKPLWMGPADFALKASTMRYDLKNEINRITEIYISLRYNDEKKISLKEFKKIVFKFKPVKIK